MVDSRGGKFGKETFEAGFEGRAFLAMGDETAVLDSWWERLDPNLEAGEASSLLETALADVCCGVVDLGEGLIGLSCAPRAGFAEAFLALSRMKPGMVKQR